MLQVHVVFLLNPDPVEVLALDFIMTLAGTPVVRSPMAVAEETPTTLNQRSSVNSPVGRVVSLTMYSICLICISLVIIDFFL